MLYFFVASMSTTEWIIVVVFDDNDDDVKTKKPQLQKPLIHSQPPISEL